MYLQEVVLLHMRCGWAQMLSALMYKQLLILFVCLVLHLSLNEYVQLYGNFC